MTLQEKDFRMFLAITLRMSKSKLAETKKPTLKATVNNHPTSPAKLHVKPLKKLRRAA